MNRADSRVFGSLVPDLVLIAIISVPLLFLSLGALPIVLWDESRLANNAIEMSHDGLSLVTTYLGHPDLWNTKPPLLIWLQAISFGIFGPSGWALRLPSALAALATAWIVYWFCRRVTASRATGIVAALALLTTYGFIAPHVARTGDYDALLVFFTTAIFAGCYFVLEETRFQARPSSGLLICVSVALVGAIMTKGVAGLLILPGIALASLIQGAILKALRDWRIWLAMCLPFVIAGGFYLARESAGSGYLEAVWANELGGRFMGPLEGHRQSAMFYVLRLLSPWNGETNSPNLASAVPWSWLALLLLPLGARNARFAPVLTYLAIVLAAFLIVISTAQTRIYWYVAPAYPPIACLVAISAFATLSRTLPAGVTPSRRRPAILLLGLFVPLVAIIGSLILGRINEEITGASRNPTLQSAAFLHGMLPLLHSGDTVRIVRARASQPSSTSPTRTEYSPQEEFYASAMRSRHVDALVVTPDYRPRQGDLLAWCDPIRPDARNMAANLLVSRGPCHLARASGAALLESGR